ncbi:hypothetical protein ACFVJM_35755 [Streptomyces virginiae]|uniref:hypothetical protein n=1 Tax=Streptomyces virginiae TaxID=1961 RepID=UPI00362B0B9A
MPDLYSVADPEYAAVATLAEALCELVSSRGALPSEDIHGGDAAEWTIVLRPAADQVQNPAAPTTVRISVGSLFTDIDVTRPLPAELIRPLTRLVMDLVYYQEATQADRGLCQFCGKAGGLSIWRPR